ncbi:MAG TPA: YceI family protein, partial [Acidimicrobiia bacterium]|nr:YceI family protein [Acidimicrobiia bacterium]
LDAEQYPLVTFESTAIAPAGGAWKLSGDLTIRGVTNPVTFDLRFEGEATDPYGNTKAAFSAIGEIDRRDWGLVWNVPLEGGGVLVSEKFKIEFDVEAHLQG